MGFSKIRYNGGEEVFRIRVENSNGSKIEEWVVMRRDFPKWVKMICSRYGFIIEPNKTDLDWAI
jgi:hypothetical protein